jgi:succinyldiaminopimelate transaminase
MAGFTPPPYPYERLHALVDLAEAHEGGMVDCSVGTPCDPPPSFVVRALGSSGLERGYPSSAGSESLRRAGAAWIERRFGVELAPSSLAACVGTKELVASTAHYLSLRDPERSVILHPEISYPTYAMGATLAGLDAVAVPMDGGRLVLEEIAEEDARRALCLWSNSPSNPTGGLDDLASVARWGRAHKVPVLSDECYAEFTWADRPRSILEHGLEGLLAVHSLSKRSNMAGVRIGFYAGDPELVAFLASVRQHAGLMVPGPVQFASALALDDDEHVDVQRAIYRARLQLVADGLVAAGFEAALPQGGFYLWVPVPEGLSDGWAFARLLAERAGLLVSPGDLYGPRGADHVRIAVVQPNERLAMAMERLAVSGAV